MGKIGLNQPLINNTPLSPTLAPIILFAPLQLSSQRNYSEAEKNLGGGEFAPLAPPSYTYAPAIPSQAINNVKSIMCKIRTKKTPLRPTETQIITLVSVVQQNCRS
jgi:hypothetical protein